jgi:hypothetical protein
MTSPVDAVDIFRGMAESCSWPTLNRTNKLGISLLIRIGLNGSGASLEDDLVQDSVGASKPANGRNNNGK